MAIIHRNSRSIGLLLLELRALIVAGEISPPWPVIPNPLSNTAIVKKKEAEYRRIAQKTQDTIRKLKKGRRAPT